MKKSEIEASSRKEKFLKAIWILAVIGLALCIELTVIYYRAFRDQGYQPVCPMEGIFDCKGNALSPYSRFLGVPNSVYGMVIYSLILILIPIRLWTRIRLFKNLELYLALLALASLGMTVYLAGVSFFILHKFCSWCVALYLVDIAFFVLVILSLESPAKVRGKFLEDLKMFRTEVGALAVAVFIGTVLIVVFVILYERSKRVWIPPGPELPAGVVLNIKGDPVIGSSRAKATIIEFSDFQCPYCRLTAQAIKKIQARYPNQVRVVFKNFPLDSTCNPRVRGSAHPNSCLAAAAGECAFKMGRFEEVYEQLMNANNYSLDSLLQMASEIGLEPNEFRSCLMSGFTQQEVFNDIIDALKLEIEGTPLLIINGRIYRGGLTEQQLDRIVKQILEGKEPSGLE